MAEQRLIDANAFKEYIRNAYEETKNLYTDNGEWAKEITESFCQDIDEQPTIEPERKTGKWCVTPDGKLVCSNCYENPTNRIIFDGNLIYDMTPIKKRMRYCPNCGSYNGGEQP